jgi:hypothetical protein
MSGQPGHACIPVELAAVHQSIDGGQGAISDDGKSASPTAGK